MSSALLWDTMQLIMVNHSRCFATSCRYRLPGLRNLGISRSWGWARDVLRNICWESPPKAVWYPKTAQTSSTSRREPEISRNLAHSDAVYRKGRFILWVTFSFRLRSVRMVSVHTARHVQSPSITARDRRPAIISIKYATHCHRMCFPLFVNY